MKIRLLFSFLLLCTCLHAQPSPGVDSAANRKWTFQEFVYPSGKANTIRWEYELIQSKQIVFARCDNQTWLQDVILDFPKTCVKAYDKSAKSQADSDALLACTRTYYAAPGCADCVDTVFVPDSASIERVFQLRGTFFHEDELFFLTKLETYTKDSSFRTVTEFYTLEELKNSCYSGEGDFRRKMSGTWSEGKKDGEWKYFDLNGNLTLSEVYENGKLVRKNVPDAELRLR